MLQLTTRPQSDIILSGNKEKNMARIRIKSCQCIDWLCCEHADDYALTGEDAVEAAEEARLEAYEREPGCWTCELCGAKNSELDSECQRCDGESSDDGDDCREDYLGEMDTDTPLGDLYGNGFEVDQ
jgi:hypothetical protein